MMDPKKLSNSESDDEEEKSKKHTKPFAGNEDSPLYVYMRSRMPEDGGVSTFLVGTSRSGKSTLMVDFLNFVFDEDYAWEEGGKITKKKPVQIVMTTSKNATPLKRLGPNVILYGEGHNRKFIEYARAMNKKYDNKFKFVICYDDVVQTKHRSEIIQLILCDRNKNISGLISTQEPKLVGPGIRNNMNRVLLLKCFTRDGTERNTDIYLRSVLPHDWNKERGYQFYEWWCKPGKGTGFLINYLDAEAVGFDENRNIYRIEDLLHYFESGKSRKQLISDLEGELVGNEEDLEPQNAEGVTESSDESGPSSPGGRLKRPLSDSPSPEERKSKRRKKG